MADGLRGRARIDTPPWYDRCAVSDSAGTDDSDLSWGMGLKQPGRTRERGSPLKASDPALGRRRGGFSLQVHVRAARRGRPLCLRMTGGQCHAGSRSC